MATSLRLKDRLDGTGNFVPWKARILLILEENELWPDIVRNTTANPVVIPASADAAALSAFNKKDCKARRIILDAVKDHIIPHISGKTRAHLMWSALISLYESSNENRKMVLKEKLKSIKMNGGEGVTAYLTRISAVRDELAAVGEVVAPTELVRTAVNGASKPWGAFVQAIVGRENLPTWDRLWDDFVQEETRRGLVQGSTSHSGVDDENVALAAKGKKKKGPKKGGAKQYQQQSGQKKDLIKIKCYACQAFGHYAS